MRRETKTAIKYMTIVWGFTTALAFIVSCSGKDGKNGLQGSPGINGTSPAPSAYDIVEVIDPCGKQAAYDEVILRMSNGTLLAHYSDGQKQFFSLIGPGNYRTTDGSSCLFSVDSNNVVRW